MTSDIRTFEKLNPNPSQNLSEDLTCDPSKPHAHDQEPRLLDQRAGEARMRNTQQSPGPLLPGQIFRSLPSVTASRYVPASGVDQ